MPERNILIVSSTKLLPFLLLPLLLPVAVILPLPFFPVAHFTVAVITYPNTLPFFPVAVFTVAVISGILIWIAYLGYIRLLVRNVLGEHFQQKSVKKYNPSNQFRQGC